MAIFDIFGQKKQIKSYFDDFSNQQNGIFNRYVYSKTEDEANAESFLSKYGINYIKQDSNIEGITEYLINITNNEYNNLFSKINNYKGLIISPERKTDFGSITNYIKPPIMSIDGSYLGPIGFEKYIIWNYAINGNTENYIGIGKPGYGSEGEAYTIATITLKKPIQTSQYYYNYIGSIYGSSFGGITGNTYQFYLKIEIYDINSNSWIQILYKNISGTTGYDASKNENLNFSQNLPSNDYLIDKIKISHYIYINRSVPGDGYPLTVYVRTNNFSIYPK